MNFSKHFSINRLARFAGVLFISVLPVLPSQAVAALGASVTLKSGEPTGIYPGEVTIIEITLANSNAGAQVSNVEFNTSLPGTLPNGLKISELATYSCYDPSGPTTLVGSGVLTATTDSQAINLSGGVIPARSNGVDGTCTILVPVTAGTSSGSSATYAYEIADGAVTGNDGGAVANTGTVSQSINVSALTKPSIVKSFSSSNIVLGGDPETLTVELRNTNPVDLEGFSITDTFPMLGGNAIIKVAAVPNATASCNNGGASPTFSPNSGDGSITVTGTIPAKSGGSNGLCTITVDIEAATTDGDYTTGAQTNTINRSTDFSNDIGLPAQSNATADITVISPLNVNKSFAHSSLSNNQTDSFTITLTNSGNTDLTVNEFEDSPIDGVDNDNTSGLRVSNQLTTCSGGAVTAIDNDTGIKLTGGVIPAGGSCSITVEFVGTVASAGVPITYTNLIPEGAVDVGDPAIVSRTRSASILVADDLRVLKSASPTKAAPGSPVKYTITTQNFTNSNINNVTIKDSLPAGMTFLAGTIGSNNFTPILSGTGCSGLTVNSALGDTDADFVIGTLPTRTDENTPGQCSVTFWAMTDSAAVDGSSTQNTLEAGDVCYNAGANCNQSSTSSSGSTAVETTVASATKRFDGTQNQTLSEGTITTLTFIISNISANPLTNVSLSDTFPTDGSGQLQVASPANASSTCGPATITATPGATSVSMNGAIVPAREDTGTGASGSCSLSVDVIGPAGVYPNTAQVAGTQTFANGVTDTLDPFDTDTATLTYLSALSANKEFSPSAISSGGTSTVRITLNNTSDTQLTNASLVDNLPSGMTLANPVNAYTTCAGSSSFSSANPGDSSISFTGANIAGNGSCDVLFDVVATGSSNWINTLAAGDITADGGIRNTTAVNATLTFVAATNIAVAKTTNPSTLAFPGQESQLTVTLTNGTAETTGLKVVDYFTVDGLSGSAANGMVVATTPGLTTDCPNGVLSAESGGESVAISGVSLPANGSCTFSVNITAKTVGGITNIIPVGAVVTDQGLTNNGAATTSLTTQSNIGVTKEFTPAVIEPGERSRLRVTLHNATPLSINEVSVTDTLPANVTVPASPNPQTSCLGGVVNYSSNSVSLTSGSLAGTVGTTVSTCYLEIDVTTNTGGTYVNTIPAGAVVATSGGSSATNEEPASAELFAKEPLVTHVAFKDQTLDAGNPAGFTTDSATTLAGTPATMTIYIENPNDEAVSGMNLVDALPSGVTIAPTPNASTTCIDGAVNATAAGTSVQLSGATLGATSSCTVSVDVISNVSGSYVNDIDSSEITTNEGVSNEEGTAAELIIATPPAVLKEFNPAVIPSGGVSTLTINFTNENSSAITLSSIFTDELPTSPGAMLVATTPNLSTDCTLASVTANAGANSVSYANGASIPAGGCSISVDVTATAAGEHVNNIPAGALETSAGSNPSPTNSSLFVSALGYISGRIFQDNDVTPDGIYTATDTPLAGAEVSLISGASCSGALVAIAGVSNPATTDSSGNYLFGSLPAGTYSVCQTGQPTGTQNGIASAGDIVANNGSTGTAGSAANPTNITSQITGIVLNDDGGSAEVSGATGNNFAEVVPSTLSGYVFKDENNNGIKNGADTGLIGETIELLDSGDNVIASTTTDSEGFYEFTDLAPGTYSIRQPNQPDSTANGITTAGTVSNGGTTGSVSAITAVPSQISTIVLPPNTTVSDNNFAEIPDSGRISGKVFVDYDNNGSPNSSDNGINGQTINLTGTDINGNPVNETTTTDNEGNFTFDDLPAGSYTLTQPDQPADTTNGITTAGSGGGTATNTATTPSSISNVTISDTSKVSGDNYFAELPSGVVDLTVELTHSPADLAAGSSNDYYTVSPSNIGDADSNGVVTVVTTIPAGITPTGTRSNGDWNCSIAGQEVTCTSSTEITSGGSGEDIFIDVSVGSGLEGQVLNAESVVSGGNEPSHLQGNNTDVDPAAINAGASVSGHVWRDDNHDRIRDVGESHFENWKVLLKRNGETVATTTTGSDGSYSFTNISPGSGYEVEFQEPSTGNNLGQPVPNESGAVFTPGVDDDNANPAGADNTGFTLSNMTLLAGETVEEQSLPVDPSGVVYDAISRQPVEGAVVTLSGPAGFDADTHLIGGSSNLSQTTSNLGLYQFLLNGGAPAGTYTLSVTSPSGYLAGESIFIPACTNTPSVGAAPNPALVQNNNTAPVSSAAVHDANACPATSAGFAAGANSTQYFFSFVLDPGLPSGNVLNNHIPLDPVLGGAINMVKTAAKDAVSQGELIPYTIQAINTYAVGLEDVELIDQTPPGFKYVAGSSRIDGVASEPVVEGRALTWSNIDFNAGESHTITLLLVPGTGVSDGEYVNQAWASIENNRASNVATATVQLVPDPTFECSDIIGKVFDDQNTNGYQDKGEPGLPGVRVATVNGELITTDKHGRYHIACAAVPDELKGSNFILKLDPQTLPSGYRVTTENPRVIRLTQGKISKLNFGASLHRVVRLDINQRMFEGDEIADKHHEKLDQLLEILQQQPAVLRIGYQRGQQEDESDASARASQVSNHIKTLWEELWKRLDKPGYDLNIEIEMIEPVLSVEAQS
ncbi:SdrD B-like domain-containing protein [Neptuniibacter sp. 2_MG-2023]|uniref:DUF7933 domain-containing protein n=1 Tax=Neptuniibacter sp. 2_MG-2023 TaxID=3062671 RepID=UPI0026E27F7D|nr:SdrD B-like domain-containing protein [Neptuniibacter sp. 2_MG-2023]MDO6514854.1 SdrD B-like domain-containing protein [Neptuniibacter sp. 2_MG-2023]